ncbi:MAG TPA: ATPase, T2SS/T4P/T4SS family [Ruminiclostridium sp.]|nr:ATPase, T2SS/T4P/T4SS family [Ruminiclostridium sp.]
MNDYFVYGTGKHDGECLDYVSLLDRIQTHMTNKFPRNQMSEFIDRKDEGRQLLLGQIERYLEVNQVRAKSGNDIESISVDIYEDMAGMSFLSKYLNNPDDYPDLEEINVNRWNSVVLKKSGGRVSFTNESFLSPKHALDVLRRILSKNNESIDEAVPGVTSSITDNIRITAFIYPIIPKDYGISASIRITRPQNISEKELIRQGSVSPEIIGFLKMCIKYSVSMCIAGKMGSGKTTFLNYLLKSIPASKRIMPIEEGSRELSLTQTDADGRLINQVIPALTKPDDTNRNQNFDTSRILQFGLRFNADYFVPQEMRTGAAYYAQEAARTGSGVLTTIHSNDAESTYPRMVTLMKLSSNLDEDTLMRLAVEAFPIIVYMRELEDSTRRIMEVLEGVRFVRGKGLECRTLYSFDVEDNKENSDGSIRVIGHFRRVNGISPRLVRHLLNNGAPKKLVDKYAMEGNFD